MNPDFSEPAVTGKKVASPVSYADLEKVVKKIKKEWGIASICDIVLNHTANESEWLKEHPDATYSCYTTPHLRPAFLLDALFAQVTADVAAGLLETVGVPVIIETEDHIQALRHQLHTVYLPKIKLYELYQCDVDKYHKLFWDKMRNSSPPTSSNKGSPPSDITLQQDPEYKRLATDIDFEAALAHYNVFRYAISKHGQCITFNYYY